MRYLTAELVQAYCRNEITTDDYEWMQIAGDSAEAFIDDALKRRIEVAGVSASARVYRPNTCERLRVHDCTEITSVSNYGAVVPEESYELLPLNGITWAGEPRPYEEIVLTSGSWVELGPRATVTVTAKWGWAEIPQRILQAALVVAKEYVINRDEVKLGLVGFSDVGGVVARTNPIVRDVIKDYRRVEAIGIA